MANEIEFRGNNNSELSDNELMMATKNTSSMSCHGMAMVMKVSDIELMMSFQSTSCMVHWQWQCGKENHL